MLVCLRRLIVLAAALLAVSAAAASAANLPAQRQEQRRVEAEVSAMSVRLEGVVNRWEGARLRLATVDTRLRRNEALLAVARTNLQRAQKRIEQRLAELYVSPNPTVVDVLAGAKSFSDLIDRIETSHALSAEDAAIGRQAVLLRRAVTRREGLLEREHRARATTVARLEQGRQTIERGLAAQRRLLASIHVTIQALEAQQAARERLVAARARARIARRIALARASAAAEAPVPLPLATPVPTATPAPAPAAPAPVTPAPAAPASAAPAPVPLPGPTVPSTHAEAASIAGRYLGVPYAWGGASPSGFDCSGLVSYVYAQLGVSLPHYTVAQWNATISIPTAELQPGDLVFFDGLGHVGIYVGGGQFIHAPHTGTVVQVATLGGYWLQHLDGARRVP